MQILWLVSSYPNNLEPTNGDFIERHALAVAKFVNIDIIHLVQVGKEVLTTESNHSTKVDNLRSFIYRFAFRKWHISLLDKIRYNLKYQKRYRAILLEYTAKYGVPDLIHVHVPMKAGILARLYANKWKIPYIVSDHSSMYDAIAKDNFDSRSLFFKYYTNKIYKDATAITNVSAVMAKKIEQLFSVRGVTVIHNVVDTMRFNYEKENKPSLFTWFHASTIYPLKNVDKIIDAFIALNKINENWVFIIAGNVTNDIINKVAASTIKNKITFLGQIPHEEIAKQMKRSSALVMFSKHENFPCAIIEALCCGLPVVSSNVGGIAEAINPQNGLLVPSENLDLLTNALHEMMCKFHQYNPVEIAHAASLKYNENTIGQQFIDLYAKLLHHSKP